MERIKQLAVLVFWFGYIFFVVWAIMTMMAQPGG